MEVDLSEVELIEGVMEVSAVDAEWPSPVEEECSPESDVAVS